MVKGKKKEATLISHFRFAEKEGFEPPVHCCTTVFKTAAIDHSAISPLQRYNFFILIIILTKNILIILHIIIKQLYIIKIKLLNNNYFVQEVKKQN